MIEFSYRSVLFILLALVLSFGAVSVVTAQEEPDVTVIQNEADPLEPSTLEKVSWESIFAGTVIALILQLTLNLLGISIGMLSINPEYDEESASPKTLGIGTAVWVGLSTLISLFVGGWVAGRLANIPDDMDGAMHGILTWAVVMLISTFLLATTIGRLLTGISTLVGQTLSLAGRAASTVASGAANVTGAAMGGAATLAGAAAGGAMNMAQSAASTAGTATRNVGDMASDTLYRVTEESPEVRDALELQDLSFDNIKTEFLNLLNRAGISTQDAQSEAQGAVQDARSAASYALRHPDEVDKMATYLLRRVLRRGQGVVGDTDRQDIIRVMSERAGFSPQQANETLQRWEQVYGQTRTQTEQARQQVMERIQGMQSDLRNRAENLQNQAERKIDQTKYRVERTTREAADTTVKAIATLAGAAFAALVLGAVAAAVGGLIGAPTEADVAEEVSQVISSVVIWFF